MTPEEAIILHVKDAHHWYERYEAEKARADKAEEVLGALCNAMTNVPGYFEPPQREEIDSYAKMYKKCLCDEIVGKIEAKHREIDGLCTDDAIDIMKSVLGGEG